MDMLAVDHGSPIRATSYGRVKKEQGAWHGGRSIRYHLLVYVVSGSVRMQVAETIHALEAGDILCIPANTFYRPLEAQGLEYFFLHFLAASAVQGEEDLHFHANPLLPSGDYEYSFWGGSSVSVIEPVTHCAENKAVKDIFLRIAALNIRSDGERLLLDCYLRELLIRMAKNLGGRGVINPAAARIAQYIDRRYREDLSLSSLADAFQLSKSYIARLFKREMNTTSVEYMNRVRTANACRLLLGSEKSIAEISQEVGFREAYYFTRVFKRQYGITPTEYRKRIILEGTPPEGE